MGTVKVILKAGVLICLSFYMGSCNTDDTEKNLRSEVKAPVNIIFMIGDGMGIGQITTMFYYKDAPSEFNNFSEIGFINTSSATNKVTDSAGAGTAFATGQKSFNRGIGLSMDSVPLPSILKILQSGGYQTGLVSVASVTHATPAAFYGQVENRDMEEVLAEQLLETGVDFFAGGGLKFFNKRRDEFDLYAEFEKAGYQMDTVSMQADIEASKKYGFLLAENGLPRKPEGRDSFLKVATQKALERLSVADDGFFLMVEGSYIDWAGHAEDADFMIAEMLDFEEALKVALDYVKANSNTLLVVTGDHETGGMAVGKGEHIDELSLYFNTDQHTADLVPVFAKGPGEELFKGFYENSDVFHKMLEAVGSVETAQYE
jgi:alkaline phosphatase